MPEPIMSLAGKSTIRAIRVVKSETELKVVEVFPTKFTVKLGMRSKHDDAKSLVHVGTTVEIAGEEQDSSVRILAIFDSIYETTQKEVDEADLQAFHDTALKDVWPYVRQFVHSTSMQMGVAPMVLPLTAVKAMNEPKSKAKTKRKKPKTKG